MKGYMSASGIKKFNDCPKSWWFRYISDYESVDGETKYLDLGNAVHDAIEALLATEELSELEEMDIRIRYEERADHYGVPPDLRSTGLDCTFRAIDYAVSRESEILGVEDEVIFDIDRPDISSEVRAKMDVATDTEIWDWKTGSIRDDTPLKEKIQGAVYMAAYRVEYGHAPEKIRFVYLKEEQVRSLDPSDEIWSTMLTHARSLAAAKEEETYPAQPGDGCHWCDYQMYCAEGGGVGTNFDWNQWTAL